MQDRDARQILDDQAGETLSVFDEYDARIAAIDEGLTEAGIRRRFEPEQERRDS